MQDFLSRGWVRVETPKASRPRPPRRAARRVSPPQTTSRAYVTVAVDANGLESGATEGAVSEALVWSTAL